MKTIKTKQALSAYHVLSAAKYTKMEDEDKIKVWKITRALKPIAEKFEDDSKDASEKFIPSESFHSDFQKAQEFERILNAKEDLSKAPFTVEEYNKFIQVFQKYNSLVEAAIKEYGDKEVELDFDPLSEDAFGKLMTSNEWTLKDSVDLGDIIM